MALQTLCTYPWSFPAEPALPAALARSHQAGNSLFHVLKHESVVPGESWAAATAESQDCLPPALLYGLWWI